MPGLRPPPIRPYLNADSRSHTLSSLTRAHLVTVALAAIGTSLFWALGLPLPFLFGPMTATLIAALAGARLAAVNGLTLAARSVIGVTVGPAVTPALLVALPQVAASVALIPFYIVAVGLVGVPWFRRVHKLDPVTAFYGAMPGGMQDMVVFGEEAGGDVRALSLIHATRVLILVALAPPILRWLYDVPLTASVGSPATDIPLHEMALMALAAVVGTIGGRRIGLFGAPIMGPLLLTAAMSLGGIIDMRPPREVILASQFFIGMSIGIYYVGLTMRELREYVVSGVAFSIVLALMTGLFTEIVSLLGLAPALDAFLAFAPGGQAELVLLAIVVGADVTYIVPHHLTRVILILAGVPVVARLMKVQPK